MARQMAQTPQPGVLSSLVRGFGRFDAAHGWGVNLVVVVVLGAVGVSLCSADRRLLRPAMVLALVLGLADWVLVQDLGFFGGVGTDPNSMIPTALVLVSGYVALVRVPVTESGPEVAVAPDAPASPRPWWDRAAPGYLTRVVAAVAATAVVLVGAVPMAAASVDPNADPILATAADGTPNVVDVPAPPFDLVDQAGRPVTLSSLRGHDVALTFLDPVCTSDCPVIAQEFRDASTLLGASSSRVVFVAVVANPIYRSLSFTDAFDRQEGLVHMRNWLFLTGSVPGLEQVWQRYGVEADVSPAGAMIDHSELAFLIDAGGHTRDVISTVPGNGDAAASSFSVYLADTLERVMHE